MRSSLGISFAALSMVAFGLLAAPAQAELLVEDPYDIGPGNGEYADNTALGGQPGDGTKPLGWGANWDTGNGGKSIQGGLEYTGIPGVTLGGTGTGEGHIDTKSSSVNGRNTPERSIAASSQTGNETELWARYLWNPPSDPGSGNYIGLEKSDADADGRVILADESSGQKLRVDHGDGSGTTDDSFPDVSAGETHLVLFRLGLDRSSGADDTIELFLDWDSTSAPTSSDADASLTVPLMTGTDKLLSFDFFSNEDVQVDEFALGESFADVSTIPEPGSLALLAPAGLLALRRRRR